MRLGRRGSRGTVEPLATATNLVVGTVWLLFVNPGLDSHEMMATTPAARRRVRVLPLEEGFDPKADRRWMSLEEAEGERLFCGMARVFANTLANADASETGDRAAIGLILCPKNHLPPRTKAERSVSAWVHDEGEGVRTGFGAVARAIRDANDHPTLGVEARLNRAKAAWERKSEEARLEGRLLPDLVAGKEYWIHVAVGDHPALPFRTTGIIR